MSDYLGGNGMYMSDYLGGNFLLKISIGSSLKRLPSLGGAVTQRFKKYY